MPSYQEIETRLITVEKKLSFLMEMGSVVKREPSTLIPGEIVETKMSLLDLYHEINKEDLTVIRQDQSKEGELSRQDNGE